MTENQQAHASPSSAGRGVVTAPDLTAADECDHGITFDDAAARGLGPREVRLRWPRGHFTAEHPCLKCGVDNLIHYASRAHYIAGDW